MQKLKKFVKKVINSNTLRWQQLCSPLSTHFSEDELRYIADQEGVNNSSKMNKRELCAALAVNINQKILEAKLKAGHCINKETLRLEPVNDLIERSPYRLYTLQEIQGDKTFLYCFDIVDLHDYIKITPKNPYTRKPLSEYTLQDINQHYKQYLDVTETLLRKSDTYSIPAPTPEADFDDFLDIFSDSSLEQLAESLHLNVDISFLPEYLRQSVELLKDRILHNLSMETDDFERDFLIHCLQQWQFPYCFFPDNIVMTTADTVRYLYDNEDEGMDTHDQSLQLDSIVSEFVETGDTRILHNIPFYGLVEIKLVLSHRLEHPDELTSGVDLLQLLEKLRQFAVDIFSRQMMNRYIII